MPFPPPLFLSLSHSMLPTVSLPLKPLIRSYFFHYFSLQALLSTQQNNAPHSNSCATCVKPCEAWEERRKWKRSDSVKVEEGIGPHFHLFNIKPS